VSAVLIWALLTCGARATTFYVGEGGNDSWVGTNRAAPLRTIQRAVDTATPGDRVVVLPGTYAGARIERSGTTNAPIALHSDLPGEAVLNTPGAANRHNSILELETWEGNGVVSCWEVCGFTVVDSPAYGIDARSTQFITIGSNRVFNSAATGIFTAFSYDAVIQGNECATNGEHGIYHNNSSDRFLIRGNVLHHNSHCGLHMNGDVNAAPPAGSPWVHDGLISDGVVENNEIYQNGTGGSGINMDGVTRTVVRNNLLWETPNNSGIALFRQNGAAGSSSNLVVNNTIVMASNGGWAINVAQSDCIHNEILNNILYSAHAWRGSIVLAHPAPIGFRSDYNIVEDSFSLDGGGTRVTFSSWKSQGYDTNSVISTPSALFVAYPTDCRLQAGAPAIDAGTEVLSVTDDADGIPRPLDGDNDVAPEYDIGAFEFISSSADSDHDGMSDSAEVTAGCSPADARDVFKIDEINPGQAGHAVLAWRGTSGRDYSISHTTNPGSQLLLLASDIPATPPLNTYTVQTDEARFYRLGVSVPPSP